ncbi:MAG: DUF760 domain-containing protein [Cyanothece sp. SIO1E1]|nr:DUF760 domain-containing protein [Cyanothece sp. SIO1E1]
MDNTSNQAPGLFSDEAEAKNSLLQYVQAMSPEMIAQLSKPSSSEVLQVIEHNIIGLLGGLPSGSFDVNITTNREHLGRLLASAMMSGYFLRGVEQRMTFEQSLFSTDSVSEQSE